MVHVENRQCENVTVENCSSVNVWFTFRTWMCPASQTCPLDQDFSSESKTAVTSGCAFMSDNGKLYDFLINNNTHI